MASASASASWVYRAVGAWSSVSVENPGEGRTYTKTFQVRFVPSIQLQRKKCSYAWGGCLSERKAHFFPSMKCSKKDEYVDPLSVERPPYDSYMDSTSGEMEPASGARASIPGQEYWPEGTVNRVRAARAPEPAGNSEGESSYGKKPGSRRKKFKEKPLEVESSDPVADSSDLPVLEASDIVSEDPKDLSTEYVVYGTAEEEEKGTSYELDKKYGRPHPLIDPDKKKPLEEPLTSEELWWNWRKPKDTWSRWQRRRPDVETVFTKAMVETGQIKIYGDHPTLTETSIYRARRHLFKEERLQAEQERLEKIGAIAYYSEWVKAWKRDTSREAVQKHFEETVWGGDPVYPTINYIQDPDEVIDYRGPEFHEPTPNMLAYLMEEGKIISRDELQKNWPKKKLKN